MKAWQCFAGDLRLRKCLWFCVLLLTIFPFIGKSQDITIENPSLEGTPAGGTVPSPWIKSAYSPDIQPGFYGVSRPASDGNTYIGLLASSDWAEGIAPKLNGVLNAGKTYQLLFDMAYTTFYYKNIYCGAVEIYGGNTPSDRKERLWFSGFIQDTAWQTVTATFTPTSDYAYLSFWAYYDSTCMGNRLSDILLDHFSTFIREVPQINVTVRNSCKGQDNGAVLVSVSRGKGPYTFKCMPGNHNGQTVRHLHPGNYEVTVTGSNGTSAKQRVQVGDYEMKAKASIMEPRCANTDNGQLALIASGGIEPYIFSLDGGATFQESPVFNSIGAGIYNAVVKDSFGCIAALDNLVIKQPEPLEVVSAKAKSASCSAMKDGQIILTAVGGSSPYRYGLSEYNTQVDSVLSGLNAGKYHYYVMDSHDCTIDGSIVVENQVGNCGLYMPSAFSPNGDGKNDIFRAIVHDDVKEFSMSVYGRWGQLVFESRNPDLGWDGRFKGSLMPAGSYVYVVTYIDSKYQTIKQTGSLLMVR